MTFETTVTAEQLQARIGTKDATEAARCLQLAKVELARATAGAFQPIPPEVADELALSVGQAFYDRRRTASTGGGQLVADGGQQLPRTPRDPLASVRGILASYVVEL